MSNNDTGLGPLNDYFIPLVRKHALCDYYNNLPTKETVGLQVVNNIRLTSLGLRAGLVSLASGTRPNTIKCYVNEVWRTTDNFIEDDRDSVRPADGRPATWPSDHLPIFAKRVPRTARARSYPPKSYPKSLVQKRHCCILHSLTLWCALWRAQTRQTTFQTRPNNLQSRMLFVAQVCNLCLDFSPFDRQRRPLSFVQKLQRAGTHFKSLWVFESFHFGGFDN